MDEILQRFIDQAPIAVMTRASIVRTVGSSVLDDIFNRNAVDQYTRDLTFGTLAQLMTKIVFSVYPSVNSAYQHGADIPVSIASVYNKLNGLETSVSEALVAETATSMDEIIKSLPYALVEDPVKGLRLRTLDGNALAGTDHRLACLRGCGAAALPGQSLVVRDDRTGLLSHVVSCEDAYTNERALYARVLALVEPDDLWLGDRNFCTPNYLEGIASPGAYFLIRHHAGTPLHPLGRETRRVETPDSYISEQRVRVGSLDCRCIIIRLKKPLEDGTTVIRLLTNVPKKRLSARKAATIYRTRWKIERAFQDLTDALQCEITTLGYPKAALFSFALAMVAYNVLVLTRAAIRAALGEEMGGEAALSTYHMAIEVKTVDTGLSIAVPASAWDRFLEMTAAEFAAWLYEVARHIDWRPYRKRPRGPKKPVEVKRTRRGAHRSTARELMKSQKCAP